MKRFICLIILAFLLPACDSKIDPPSVEQQEAILKNAPEIFSTRDGHATLRGIEALYLGQSKDEALEEIAKLCPDAMEYRTGEMSEKAWFRGCVLREPRGPIVSVRVGFWPRIGDRVATLEVKHTNIGLDAVRERFRDFADTVETDLPRPGILEMRAQKYQLMADIDEGAKGPSHITLGYTQEFANTLAAQ